MQHILSDPLIMSKMEKAFAQMSTAFRSLSKVCGLISKKGTKSSDSQSCGDNVSQIGSKSSDLKKPEETCEPVSWEDDVFAWILSYKSSWGLHHSLSFAKHVIGRRYRADNYRNYWMYTGPTNDKMPTKSGGNDKTNWRPCSEATVKTLYQKYCSYLEETAEYVRKIHTDGSEEWDGVHKNKKTRVNNIIKAVPITEKAFILLMKGYHKDFKQLRGHRTKTV